MTKNSLCLCIHITMTTKNNNKTKFKFNAYIGRKSEEISRLETESFRRYRDQHYFLSFYIHI